MMAPREELITSAITFLQDPSVASSPLDKRIAFLQSKNLTQEEIDLSLARAADESSSVPPQSQATNGPYYLPQQQQNLYRRNPPPGSYNYNQYGDWQPPPPELPKRDWRDWFIMATVVGGAGYGLYVLTQRYIKPLIAPPTPPQLEQDKAAIDEQFTRAFALLDTLSSDTTALKDAEEARTRRLDTTLTDVEAVISDLKAANQRREDDSRRMEAEVRGIKDALPKALDSVREGSEKRLQELGRELGSLKLLMGNRFGTGSAQTPTASHSLSTRQPNDGNPRSGTATPAAVPTAAPEAASGSDANVPGVDQTGTTPSFGSSSNAATASPLPTASGTVRTDSASRQAGSISSLGPNSISSLGRAADGPYSSFLPSSYNKPTQRDTSSDSSGTPKGLGEEGRRWPDGVQKASSASIPAWQRAATNASQAKDQAKSPEGAGSVGSATAGAV